MQLHTPIQHEWKTSHDSAGVWKIKKRKSHCSIKIWNILLCSRLKLLLQWTKPYEVEFKIVFPRFYHLEGIKRNGQKCLQQKCLQQWSLSGQRDKVKHHDRDECLTFSAAVLFLWFAMVWLLQVNVNHLNKSKNQSSFGLSKLWKSSKEEIVWLCFNPKWLIWDESM